MTRSERTSLPLSLLVGALIVPLTAVASIVIASPRVDPAGVAEVVTETTTSPVLDTMPSLSSDLASACGPQADGLSTLVEAGTASHIQQAALDALRPICDAVGMPLSDKVSEPASAEPASVPPTAESLVVVTEIEYDD